MSEREKSGKIALFESRSVAKVEFAIFRRFFTLSEYNLSERKTLAGKDLFEWG